MGLADRPQETRLAVHAELEQEVLHGLVNKGPADKLSSVLVMDNSMGEGVDVLIPR